MEEVLRSGMFILGPEVEAFEQECAAYLGVDHAIAVSSGTDALVLALMALDIGPGDEVVCPTYTFFATAGSIRRLGAVPVFVDASPCCYHASAARMARVVTPRTKALMPVHLFGQCAEMNPILELAVERGLAVIEDAAQAIGAEDHGRKAGAMGDIGCFSFYPTKTLGGFGEGGLVTTGNSDLAAKIRMLRNHGCSRTYEHEMVGGNFRMDALQGALLRLRLPQLPALIQRRREIAVRYRLGLREGGMAADPVAECVCGDAGGSDTGDAPLLLPFTCQDVHTWNQFVIRVGGGKRDALRAHLAAKGIGTAIYYPKPLHLQPCFAGLAGKAGDHPVAEMLAGETLALPMFPQLSDDEVARVVAAVRGFFDHP